MVTVVTDCSWSSSHPAPSGPFCPPAETWQCLETSLVLTAGGGVCWWVPGGAGKHPAVARTAPTAKSSEPPSVEGGGLSRHPAPCQHSAAWLLARNLVQVVGRPCPLHLSLMQLVGQSRRGIANPMPVYRNQAVFQTDSQAGHPRRPLACGRAVFIQTPSPREGLIGFCGSRPR